MTPITPLGINDQDPSTPASAATMEKANAHAGAYVDEQIGAPQFTILDLTPDNFGAVGDGIANDTEAAMRAQMYVTLRGGGTISWDGTKTYAVSEFCFEPGISHDGHGATLIPVAGSTGPMLTNAPGTIQYEDFRNFQFLPNGNPGQDCFNPRARLGAYRGGGIVTAGSKTITNAVSPGGSWAVGHYIYGWGIPAGTTVTEKVGTTLTLSAAATKGSTEPTTLYRERFGASGGLSYVNFENIGFGSSTAPWQGSCEWLQGGAENFTCPIQFITHHNCQFYFSNTGTYATTSRCIKGSGQCNKIFFDGACHFNGAKTGELVGTAIEWTREFLPATTLTAEAAAGSKVLELASVAGLEANDVILVGEGLTGDPVTIEKIEGLKVTTKTALVNAHASGQGIKKCTHWDESQGGGPSTQTPDEIIFDLGAIQNAELGMLVDIGTSQILMDGLDFENVNMPGLSRTESKQIIGRACNVALSSKGTSAGTCTVTVGAKIITGVTTLFAKGDYIYGPGFVAGTKVEKVTETSAGHWELELSAAVGANGTEGAQTGIPIIKGSQGTGGVWWYQGTADGHFDYQISGPSDQGVISGGSARPGAVWRGSTVSYQTSKGMTRSVGSAEKIQLAAFPETVITSATTTIKLLMGLHSTGDTVRLRAKVKGVTLEKGGNMRIPAGGKLVLEEGDVATFSKADDGLTWVLVGLFRAASLP